MAKGKKRKRLKKLGLFVLALLVFVASALLLLPHIVSINPVKNRVAKKLSSKLHADVKIEKLGFSLLPKPALRAGGIQVKSPIFSFRAEGFYASAKLVPLLSKRLEIDSLILESPKLVLVKTLRKGKGKASIPALPPATLVIRNGALEVKAEGEKLCLSSINGTIKLNKERLSVNLSLKAPFVKKLKLKGSLDTGGKDVELKALFAHLDASRIPLGKMPGIAIKKSDISASVNLLKLEKMVSVRIGMLPSKVEFSSPATSIGVEGMDCSVSILPERIHVELERINLKDPSISFKASLEIGKGRSELLIKEIKGNWTGVRDRLLGFFWNKRGVLKLCSIVKRARIIKAEISSEGKDVKHLFELGKLNIKGEVEGAKALIPGLLMEAENLSCNFSLSRGILNIQKASSTVENIDLTGANFTLDLTKEEHPFSLESDMGSTLENTWKVLKTLPLPGDMASILKRVKGRGPFKAHIRLKGPAKNPKLAFLKVETRGVNLSIEGIGLPLFMRRCTLIYRPGFTSLNRADMVFGRSHLTWKSVVIRKTKTSGLKVTQLRGKLTLHDIRSILKSRPKAIKTLNTYLPGKGEIEILSLNYTGNIKPKTLLSSLEADAILKDVDVFIPGLFPATIGEGLVRYRRKGLSFNLHGVRIAESLFHGLSGNLNMQNGIVTLKGNGTVKKPLLTELLKGMPGKLVPITPITVRSFHLTKSKNSADLHATLKTPRSSWIKVSFNKSGKELGSSIEINTESGPFILTFSKGPEGIRFTSKGKLKREDLMKIFPNFAPFELLRIDLKGLINRISPRDSEVDGSILVEGLNLKDMIGTPITLRHIRARSLGRSIIVEKISLLTGKSGFEGSGMAVLSGKVLDIKGSLHSGLVVVQDIKKIFPADSGKESTGKKRKAPGPGITIDARLDLAAGLVTYKDFYVRNVKITFSYIPGAVKCIIRRADLCGINVEGSFEEDLASQSRSLGLSFGCKSCSFHELKPCAKGINRLFKGNFALEGNFSASGKELLNNAEGSFRFVSRKGRVYRFGLVDKLFTFLNPLDVFKGNLPDIKKKGFEYSVFEIDGRFKGSYLIVDFAQLVGSGLRVFSSGRINIPKKRVDFTVLTSPFKNVDSVINKIPLIGWVLTGRSKTLLSIPVRIEGPIDNPTVTPMDPKAVSKKILGIAKRTLKLPIRMVNPFRRKENIR